MSPDMSESLKPLSIGFSTPYLRHTLEVPFKYQSIYFTAVQCSLPGLLMYRLTVSTANAMSGLVQTIAYIKLPTTEGYGTPHLNLVLLPFLGIVWRLACSLSVM